MILTSTEELRIHELWRTRLLEAERAARGCASPPRSLGPRTKLDVAIDWPVLLDGGCQLQLVVKGVVVWSTGTKTAPRIQRCELRTRGGRY